MSLLFLFIFVFSAVLNAQQNTISLELDPTNFPKGCVFNVELVLKFSVIDTKKMLAEGRRVVADEDYLLKQTSTNSGNWAISYDSDGKPIIEGSPKVMDFNFSKPVSLSSDVRCLITFEGKIELVENGKVVAERPLRLSHQLQPDDTFVLRLNNETRNDRVLFGYWLLSKGMLQDMLEGKGTSTVLQETRTITVPVKSK